MDMETAVGAIRFGLAGAARCWWPGPEVRPFPSHGQEPIDLAVERGRRFFVVDHRHARGAPGPAHVELWRPLGAVEGGLEGMFVLCDADGPAAPPCPRVGLVALAGQIGGERPSQPTFYPAVAAATLTNYEPPPHSPV
jgi:hypothetical protein